MGWGGAHEGLHFSQTKNAFLLNFCVFLSLKSCTEVEQALAPAQRPGVNFWLAVHKFQSWCH